jgi:hypothetical protein
MRIVARSALQLSIRAATAATLAYAVAQGLGLPGPIYALISGVMVTDLDRRVARPRDPRILGTVLGTVLGGVAAPAMAYRRVGRRHRDRVAMLLAHVLRKPEAARLPATCGALVMLSHGQAMVGVRVVALRRTLLGIRRRGRGELRPQLLRDAPPRETGPRRDEAMRHGRAGEGQATQLSSPTDAQVVASGAQALEAAHATGRESMPSRRRRSAAFPRRPRRETTPSSRRPGIVDGVERPADVETADRKAVNRAGDRRAGGTARERRDVHEGMACRPGHATSLVPSLFRGGGDAWVPIDAVFLRPARPRISGRGRGCPADPRKM